MNAARHWSGCIALLGALTLPGCAWLSPPPAPSGAVQALPASWAVAGRLGVKAAGKGSYANFDWKRQGGVDTFDITTPLGQTVARLSRDASGVRLTARVFVLAAHEVDDLVVLRRVHEVVDRDVQRIGRAPAGAVGELLLRDHEVFAAVEVRDGLVGHRDVVEAGLLDLVAQHARAHRG